MRLRDTPEYKDLDPEELCERISELTRKKDFWKQQYGILESAASKWEEENERLKERMNSLHVIIKGALNFQGFRRIEYIEKALKLLEASDGQD